MSKNILMQMYRIGLASKAKC